MKGVSNEGQFKKARKEMPEFFKDSSSAKNDKSNVMDKANPAALRLANGGSARQPRNGKMQFVKGGTVKRNMGGILPSPMGDGAAPVVDGVEQMMGKPQKPPMLPNNATMMRGMGQMSRPGLGRMGPPGMAAPPVPTMGGPDPQEMAGPMQQVGGEGPGFKRGGAVPRNKMGRHSMKEDAADKKADAISAKKRGMTPAAFEGTKADEKMDRAGSPPFRRGGAPIKRAMGGIGKARHDEASYEGKPKAAPKGKKLFEAI